MSSASHHQSMKEWLIPFYLLMGVLGSVALVGLMVTLISAGVL